MKNAAGESLMCHLCPIIIIIIVIVTVVIIVVPFGTELDRQRNGDPN